MWQMVEIVGDVLFALSAVGAVVFVLMYVFGSRWRSTPAGRVTAALWAAVAAILVGSIIFGIWQGHDRAWTVTRVLLYGLLFSGICRYIVLLWRAQREDQHNRQL